jgi:four helix bundle protein
MNAQELRDRSERFALNVVDFCDTLPKDSRTQEIAGQLQDAATSVFANYRAACRGRSPAEFLAKICITVEEADEALGWLELLVASRKASGTEVHILLREATELVKIFAASKRTAKANQQRHPKSLKRKSASR